MPESQSNESPNLPNSSGEPTLRRKSTRERLAKDFPNSVRQVKNPLARTQLLNRQGQVRQRLGITDVDMAGVPSITPRVKEAVGSVREAVQILSGDDAPDSVAFMQKWNSLGSNLQKYAKVEDVAISAGLTTRRFMEILAGASLDHHEFVFKTMASSKKSKVLKSVVKSATDESPIVLDGKIIGHEPPDVKAMELFFKLTGDIKPSGGVVVNSNNQTANISAAPTRDPLQSMDNWLLEIEDVRKPKQLAAPVIPVEIPVGAPEIEYMPLGDE